MVYVFSPNGYASVDAEFDTATVAKKIGRGFTTATKGDFNNDYNDDFNN